MSNASPDRVLHIFENWITTGILELFLCGEIYRKENTILGYTAEYIDIPEVEIEFDSEYGEYSRTNETWNGFNEIVEAINNRHLFYEKNWLEKVRSVGEYDEL